MQQERSLGPGLGSHRGAKVWIGLLLGSGLGISGGDEVLGISNGDSGFGDVVLGFWDGDVDLGDLQWERDSGISNGDVVLGSGMGM